MINQTLSPERFISPTARLAPTQLIEWTSSSSGTQWEKFRDSGSLDSGVHFVDSPFQRWHLRLTAILILAVAVAAWLLTGPLHHPSRIETVSGEQRTLTLADGSILSLGANSDARIAFTPQDRRVILARGQARFTIATDSERPFLVSTRHATMKAIGATFDVSTVTAEAVVTVLTGRVIILPPIIEDMPGAKPATPQSLSRGERAYLTRDGEVFVLRAVSGDLGL